MTKQYSSCRDFVYIRHWEEQDGWYLVCSLSTVYKGMPHHSKYVRGHQGPTIVRMKRITENKLLIEWTMNIDVKVSLTVAATSIW